MSAKITIKGGSYIDVPQEVAYGKSMLDDDKCTCGASEIAFLQTDKDITQCEHCGKFTEVPDND